MAAFYDYLGQFWRYRFLTRHLAEADLRARFRGSYVGALWLMVNPLVFTAIFSLIFGLIFGAPLKDYAPYVLVGVVVWEFVAGALGMSTQSILSAEGYLRQARIPQLVFCVRTILYLAVCFVFAFVAVLALGLIFIDGFNPLLALLWLAILLPLTLVFVTPLGIISAVANTRFRDYQQVIGHLIMVCYYLSPVFIPREQFERPELQTMTSLNPFASLLDLYRDTILHGSLPSGHDLLVILAWSAGLWCIAVWSLARTERDTIFYF